MDKKREKYIMENEKNEMKKKPGKVLPWLAAVLLVAALAARAAVPCPRAWLRRSGTSAHS